MYTFLFLQSKKNESQFGVQALRGTLAGRGSCSELNRHKDALAGAGASSLSELWATRLWTYLFTVKLPCKAAAVESVPAQMSKTESSCTQARSSELQYIKSFLSRAK